MIQLCGVTIKYVCLMYVDLIQCMFILCVCVFFGDVRTRETMQCCVGCYLLISVTVVTVATV